MNKRITFLILLGMVFVLTFILMGLAFVEVEYDELPSIEVGTVTGVKVYLLLESFLSGFQLAVFAMILTFEYLRSHIGEKRFSEDTVELRIPFFVFLTTALFGPSFVFIPSEGH